MRNIQAYKIKLTWSRCSRSFMSSSSPSCCIRIFSQTSVKWRAKKLPKKIQFLVIMNVFERIIRNVVIRSSIIHELKCLKRFFFEKLSPIHIIVCGYHPKTEFQISKDTQKIGSKTWWNLPYNKEFSHFDNLGSLRFSDDSCGQLESSRYLTEKVWDAIWTKKWYNFYPMFTLLNSEIK